MSSPEPKSLAVRCPKCGASFRIDMELAGKCGRCRCGHVFEMPPIRAGASPAVPAGPAAVQYVGIACRVCQTRMFGRIDQVGRTLKCPDCGALTVLPPPETEIPKAQPCALEGEQYELWDDDYAPSNAALLAAQPRYIAVECELCQTLMYAEPEQVGKKIRCPDCRHVTVVPPPVEPKPKRAASMDEEGYELEDTPVLTKPPPVIVPPRRPMLYEEERDAQLARQEERRAKGKRGGPQFDARGRPILPRWPLVTRVVPFMCSRGVPLRWVTLSVGLLVVLGLGSVALATLGAGGGPMGARIAVMSGVCLGVAAVLIGVIWYAALSNILLTIVVESSEGNDEIQEWPPLNFADWLAYMLSTMIAVAVSAIPGWAVGKLTLDSGLERGAAISVCILVLLPVVLLSQLDTGSMFAVFSGRVLKSLGVCFWSWMMFYFEIAILGAVFLGVLLATEQLGTTAVLISVPVVIGALLLAIRLLGRLAWKLAETMPPADETESSNRGDWAT